MIPRPICASEPVTGLRRFLRTTSTVVIGVALVSCGGGAADDDTMEGATASPAATQNTGAQGGPGSEQVGVHDRVRIEVLDP